MDVLSQQPVAIAVPEGIDEEIARLFAASDQPPSVDQPEAAGEECRFGHPKVVLVRVAHHVLAASELLFNGGDGSRET